ncbi:hypothetical protein NO2_0725 [Candidatus Termititenax persephonae]|uniref:Uncharacterized protein n=1 Tax=Candidatus Termititenax persephonae TaxID=2218525 RepID=A0A388TH30_9BACT|nr:hypothetical protein NO2_0725 [Candidatus Termititenax persephonae]
MRKGLLVLLVCLVSLGFGLTEPRLEEIKTYDDFESFYADWEKYRALSNYCYIEQSINQDQLDDTKDYTQLLSLMYQTELTTEYSFAYKTKNGDIYAFTFSNMPSINKKNFYAEDQEEYNKAKAAYEELIKEEK